MLREFVGQKPQGGGIFFPAIYNTDCSEAITFDVAERCDPFALLACTRHAMHGDNVRPLMGCFPSSVAIARHLDA